MIKRIIMAALCSLTLCGTVCGCGTEPEELLIIGESEEEITFPLETATAESEEAEIYVYVCGAVNNPGVVSLREGSRAEDALKAAGGFRSDAARDFVNLAARVTDGEKLYFPFEGEETVSEQDSKNGLVNINTADVELLCTLPGIGESRAADIIRYRENVGLFQSCEDIMQVSGIKNSVYNKICDRITVK